MHSEAINAHADRILKGRVHQYGSSHSHADPTLGGAPCQFLHTEAAQHLTHTFNAQCNVDISWQPPRGEAAWCWSWVCMVHQPPPPKQPNHLLTCVVQGAFMAAPYSQGHCQGHCLQGASAFTPRAAHSLVALCGAGCVHGRPILPGAGLGTDASPGA